MYIPIRKLNKYTVYTPIQYAIDNVITIANHCIQPTDNNECSLSPCEQNCTNTVGSFACSCSDGYVLNTNGQSCNGQFTPTQSSLSKHT